MNGTLKRMQHAFGMLCQASPLLARFDALLRERFVKFLLVGAMNTLFGYGVFLVTLTLTGHSILSLAVSWFIGVLFNFRTTGRLVFKSSDQRLLARFVSVYVAVFAVNAFLLRALEWTGFGAAIAAAILTPVMAVLSYLLARNFVFSVMGSKGRAA